MAIDAEGNYLTYNGTTNKWSSPASFDAAGAPEFVSCPSSSFCMAVDGSGNDLTWNGTIWSAATNFDGTNMVTSVSCRASNFCIAVDDAGNAFTYNGSWTQPKDIDGTRELTAVSCNSSGFCVAVDNHGNAVIRSGGNWALPQGIDGTTPLWGVSVVSSSFAVAVDEDGNALMYNGSSWSTTDIDGFEELQSASCTSTTFCAVVDVAGHAGFYSQSGTQQLIWDTAASEPLVLSDGTNYYVYGATGEPVEQVNVTASPPSSNPVFLTYTQSDSSWLATNTSGNELAFWRYDAFGTVALGTPDSPFGYAGQFADTSSRVPSGFGNMRARWYQAQTGQFTSVDPDFGQSDQAYDYANDDPVNGVDPTGLCSLPGRFGFLYPGKCTHNPKLLREIAAGYAELGQLQKESGGGLWGALANAIKVYDPFYGSLVAYDKEYHAAQNHESIATIASLGGDAVFDIALGESFVDGGEAADESEEEGSESGIAPDGESSGETGAVGGPRPSPNFVEPTNAAQLPPSDLPSGYSVRVMPPTDQYPDGYWVETNETGQFVDPSTGRPPSNVSRAVARSMTHVPLPPGG
jgi:RHS repeat-associated protein